MELATSRITPHTDRNVGPWTTVWRPGDERGKRQFAHLGALSFEAGGENRYEVNGLAEYGNVIPDSVAAYETYGTLTADKSNAVLLLGGFSADSHAAGPAGPGHPEAGWWDAMVGPGKGIDTNEFYVVVPNVLGGCQGSTGPGQLAPDGVAWGSRFPRITVRDMVSFEAKLADALGIDKWHGVIGVSLGGQRALEWGATFPDRVENLVVIGANAVASADQIGWNSTQIRIIERDRAFQGGDYYAIGSGVGPVEGMADARAIAHQTYRTPGELRQRFGNQLVEGSCAAASNQFGRFEVERYLRHAGARLSLRFDPNSYCAITDAMNSHDLGRGRGNVFRALKTLPRKFHVLSITTDRLFPDEEQRFLVKNGPEGGELHLLDFPEGHDGFLVARNSKKMADAIAAALEGKGSASTVDLGDRSADSRVFVA